MNKVIPAIDIIDGKCVRLTKGEYETKKVYSEDPLEMARKYESLGARRIHIVDLDAARKGSSENKPLIKKIIKETSLHVQTGGGVRKRSDLEALLKVGCSRVIIGSKAQTDRKEVAMWIKEFGADNIIIGADVRNNKIAIHGWLDTSQDDITDFIYYYQTVGAKHILCTDIMKDGFMDGPSYELYNNLINKFPDMNIIASGGVATENDIKSLIEIGMNQIVVGKAIYEGTINLEEVLKKY